MKKENLTLSEQFRIFVRDKIYGQIRNPIDKAYLEVYENFKKNYEVLFKEIIDNKTYPAILEKYDDFQRISKELLKELNALKITYL